MKIINENQKLQAIDWARQMEKLVRFESADTADRIDEEIRNLADIKLNIAVVGLLKRGKSTFCNAFLGRRDDLIAPTGRFPATGVITEFNSDLKREYANVVFTDGTKKEIGYAEIRSFVTEEGNPENCKNVLKLEVFGNFDLDSEVKLIDMPGDGSIHAYHSEIVYNYLPNADVILFMSSADDPISQRELSLLRKISANDMKKIFFVVNKVDCCDADEIAEADEHNRNTISRSGITVENDIYLISARNAMNKNGATGDFDKLISDIREFLNEDRHALLLRAFFARVTALSKPVIENIAQREAFSQKSTAELECRIQELKIQKQTMMKEFRKGSAAFAEKWDLMLEEFERELPQARERIEQKLLGGIDSTSALFLSQKEIERMPEKMSDAIEHELNISCGTVISEAENALRNLEKSCPSIAAFLGEQNCNLKIDKQSTGIGGWIFTLTSGASAYITGSTIAAAGAVGSTWGAGSGVIASILAFAGKATGIALGTGAGILLGPLFLVSAAGATLGLSGLLFSMLRKKKLQKQQLISEVKSGIKNSFDAIKIQRIPYLRQQKQQLLETIKRELERKIEILENNLNDALKQKEMNGTPLLVSEQQKNLIAEYSTLTQDFKETI